MPTYEYRCLKCRKTFSQFQRITDPPLERCVRCKGAVERLISAGVGFIFKGSGFYITDYKKQKTAGEDRKAQPGGHVAATDAPAGK